MFENLRGEMGKKRLTIMDFARNDKIKASYTSLRNKFAGITDWTRTEMLAIKNEYFPDKEIEYLFEK